MKTKSKPKTNENIIKRESQTNVLETTFVFGGGGAWPLLAPPP